MRGPLEKKVVFKADVGQNEHHFFHYQGSKLPQRVIYFEMCIQE